MIYNKENKEKKEKLQNGFIGLEKKQFREGESTKRADQFDCWI
jgi:hypothetical protein